MKIIENHGDSATTTRSNDLLLDDMKSRDLSLLEIIITDSSEKFKDIFRVNSQYTCLFQTKRTDLNCVLTRRLMQKCLLASSPYSPDSVWCLAAVYNARKIMTFLHEESVMVTQANSHGNNMLHCLVAYASTMDEAVEEEAVATVAFIQELLDEDEYKQLLLSENEHGLRPLELAAHLGAFVLYKYFLNTKGVYITREETFMWYTIQYYDVTEYMDRTRFVRSPPFLMMHLDQEKLCHRSVKDVYLGEPMMTWFQAIHSTYLPYICIAAIIRFMFIVLFFTYVTITFLVEIYIDEGLIFDKEYAYYGYDVASIISFLGHSQLTLLVTSCIVTFWDLVTLVRKTLFQPKWIHLKVTGRKNTVTNYTFYRVVQFLTLLLVLSCTAADFNLDAKDLQFFIAASVIICVWNILYFLQLLPIFDIYVIAAQRMLKDFANFSLLFILFFIPYVFGFWMLYFDKFDPYRTFLIMLHMVEFEDIDFSVQLMHLFYVFVVVILLLTYIVAMLGSTYEHVRDHGELLRLLQFLSVTLVAQEYFPYIFCSLHTRMCKRHMLYENGRFYITRVQMKPRNKYPMSATESAL